MNNFQSQEQTKLVKYVISNYKKIDILLKTFLIFSLFYLILFFFQIAPFGLDDAAAFFVLITGFIWYFYKKFKKENKNNELIEKIENKWTFNYTVGIFPFVAILFFIRMFIIDITVVPSGSMKPTLNERDYLLISKYSYGLKIPFVNLKVFNYGADRFDVALFKHPTYKNQIYVKRIIGLPGDKIEYVNKELFINDEKVSRLIMTSDQDGNNYYMENIADPYMIIENLNNPAINYSQNVFVPNENCKYEQTSFSCIIPQNNYFVMGDNRDNSLDSRYWGMVPENLLYGKAQYIFLNMNNMKNVGKIN